MNSASPSFADALDFRISHQLTGPQYLYVTEVFIAIVGTYIWLFSNHSFYYELVHGIDDVMFKVLFDVPTSIVNKFALEIDRFVWWYLGFCGFLD